MDFNWGDLLGKFGGYGGRLGGWAMDNPLQALSLGTGLVGTGMGIWDQYRAQRDLEQRRKLAEQMMQMGPTAYAPNYSPQQMQAMYFRPAAQMMALQGQTEGGSFQNALAEAALKAESDRLGLGNQIYGNRLAALGYGQPVPASGTTGAFGQSLQTLMLMNALRNQGGAQAPGTLGGGSMSSYLDPSGAATATSDPTGYMNIGGPLDFYRDMSIPNMGQIQYNPQTGPFGTMPSQSWRDLAYGDSQADLFGTSKGY